MTGGQGPIGYSWVTTEETLEEPGKSSRPRERVENPDSPLGEGILCGMFFSLLKWNILFPKKQKNPNSLPYDGTCNMVSLTQDEVYP